LYNKNSIISPFIFLIIFISPASDVYKKIAATATKELAELIVTGV